MAFFQDPSRQPFLRAPPVVLWLIALLLGVHALLTTVFAQSANAIYGTYGFIPAHYSQVFLAHSGYTIFDLVVPFISYIFLHGSWSHVLINSVWLLPFGPVVARRFGSLVFVVFFLFCGIAAALAHLAIFWGSPNPVIGASGAISGLMAAGFRMFPAGEVAGARPPLAPIFSRRILVWTLLWCLINVIAGVTGLGTGGGVNLVAWGAHMGGYFAGLLLAGPFESLTGRRNVPINQ